MKSENGGRGLRRHGFAIVALVAVVVTAMTISGQAARRRPSKSTVGTAKPTSKRAPSKRATTKAASTTGPTVSAPAVSAPAVSAPPVSIGTAGSPAASTANAAATPSPTVPSLSGARPPLKANDWKSCDDGEGMCADIQVPLDYTKPNDRKITLGLVKIVAKGSNRIGSILVNPGGPGSSGRKFARQLSGGALPDAVRDRFDLIGFDPRGVADNIPIHCATNELYDRYLAVDPNPDNEAEFQAIVAANEEFTKGCEKENSAVLPFVSTEDVVRDMDQIRAALGEETISYMGFSYGTYLGAKYVEAFPKRVRAFMLDGVLDPTADSDERVRQQAIGFEGQLNRFLDSCDKRTCTYIRKGESAGSAFDRIMNGLETNPLKVGKRTLGPGEAWTGTLGALYNANVGWKALESALKELDRGSGEGMLGLADQYNRRSPDGNYNNVIDANWAINCLDIPASRDLSHYKALSTELTAIAPRLGSLLAYSSMLCAIWPIPPTGSLQPLTGAGSKPVLLIGTTGDPATPFVWAQSVARQIQNSVLLTYDGNGHTALLTRNECVRKVVAAYMIDLLTPTAGTTCTSTVT
jgi:pimeloyl-ACP methyl ester carboxylesterase